MCSRTISVPIRYTSKCLTDSHAVEKPFPAENGKHDYIPYVLNDASDKYRYSASIYRAKHHSSIYKSLRSKNHQTSIIRCKTTGVKSTLSSATRSSSNYTIALLPHHIFSSRYTVQRRHLTSALWQTRKSLILAPVLQPFLELLLNKIKGRCPCIRTGKSSLFSPPSLLP